MKIIKFYPNIIAIILSIFMGSFGLVFPVSTVAQTNSSSSKLQQLEELDLLIKYATQKATKLKQEGQYDNAISLLDQVLKIKQQYSDSFFGFNLIAEFYQSQGDYLEAERLFLKALGNITQLVSETLKQLEFRAKEAETRIRDQYKQLESIAQDPQRLQVLDTRIKEINTALSSGQFQGRNLNPQQLQRLQNTKQQLEEFRNLAKNPPALKARLDELQTQLRDQKLERVNKAKLTTVDGMAGILNNLASIYQNQGKKAEAEMFLEETLALLKVQSPNLTKSLNNIAEFYKSQGRNKEAQRLYIQAAQLTGIQ